MVSISSCFDEIEKSVMDELKDFQRATVERIDCLFRKGQKRILVSDEVGLGKTLVARGTIAKFTQLKKDQGAKHVKIVYICSNANIAEQNLYKLRPVQDITVDEVNTSRLSMQHLNIFMKEHDDDVLNGYIQLIPLTPDTSFKITNSQGLQDERALMFSLLKEVPEIKPYLNKLDEILKHNVSHWDDTKRNNQNLVDSCNKKSNGDYVKFMVSELSDRLNTSEKDLLDYLKNVDIDKEENREKKNFIVKLRLMFSDISLKRLDPDLIIMDEFQRFKYLLNSKKDSEMGKIINKFFNNENMRILMLSATPYKMYSTLDEITEEGIDEHYSEFFEVMNFLNMEDDEISKFEKIWKNYSIELKEFNKDKTSFILAKNKAEDAMYKNVCRTERITENLLSDMVDDSDAKPLNVIKEDITSFLNAQKLMDDIGLNINVPFDYIKSSPYIMSFMRNYKLKKKTEEYFKENPEEINKMDIDTFWLDENEIDNYNEIPFNNSRLSNLMGHVLKDNAEKLLWIPPSMPYYELKGPFENNNSFSKTLIFSSWEMVPRMISSMVSYEIERRTIGKLDSGSKNLKYFADKNTSRYPSSRINFNLSSGTGKPNQLYLFSLFYPSKFLMDIYDPVDCLNRKLSLNDIKNEIESFIIKELYDFQSNQSLRDDFRWYLAPLFLDFIRDKNMVNEWLMDIENLIKTDKDFKENNRFKKHFKYLKYEINNFKSFNDFGKQPDDLYDVLCDIAIASPAICAYRSYARLTDGNQKLNEEYNKFSFTISKKFIDFMNITESIAAIDLIYKSNYDDAYWKNILKYSKDGNLQAVFDEYIHLLSSGLIYESDGDKITNIHESLKRSFNLRTAPYYFDTFNTFKSRILFNDKTKKSFRSHFAVSFIKGDGDKDDYDRRKVVRDAFNSPFRPFVLTSTSIGQEGLDFHNYCRRIVHWNLPANPIYLEQREGRINRYESLAIRQNIAKRYGDSQFKEDIWDELFEYAAEREGSDTSDLIPFWGLKDSEDMIKIERIVPMYPFSKDVNKYDGLIDILSLYRLTLGQTNQEYLIHSIFKKLDKNDDIKELFINLSPYFKKDVGDLGEISKQVSKHFNSPLFEKNPTLKPEEDNLIFNESQKYNLPINFLYSKLTTCEDLKGKYKVNVNLNDYWLKLKKKINQNNLFENNLFKWDFQTSMIPISDVILDLARIEMVIHNGFIEVKLYSPNDYHINIYDYLLDNKEEIEKELGFELNYFKARYWRISIYTKIDVTNKNTWEDAINWHIFMAKRFDEVFSHRIREYYDEIPLVESNNFHTQYWREVAKKLFDLGFVGRETPHPGAWYCLLLDDVPLSDCRIELHAYTHRKQIKVSIIIERNRQDLFNYLLESKADIENELGFELDWVESQGRRHIRKTNKIDINDKSNWSDAIDWQLKIANKFKEVFNHRIIEFYERLFLKEA